VELSFFLANRFEYLRQIIEHRQQRIRKLEQETLVWFDRGNLNQIKLLMIEKDRILNRNKKLYLFIEKWEKQALEQASDHLYTSL
jgi:hypothetical protein